MIWWFTARSHEASISPWVRNWIRSSMINRLFALAPLAISWWIAWAFIAALAKSSGLFGFMAIVPFGFWLFDGFIDARVTSGEIKKLMTRDDVVLATRTEYIGGHPRLPHGRFAYLTLAGSRENPSLTLLFPGNEPTTHDELFEVPLLDIDKHDPKTEDGESPAAELLASLSEKPGKMFAEERVILNVRYQGLAGRKHIVELSSFYHGGDEVRNWRNYLVCAQAEADTGITPRQPWKSLQSAILANTVPLEEVSIGHGNGNGTGNGSKEQSSRSAFERR
jgi:hypothetical protein